MGEYLEDCWADLELEQLNADEACVRTAKPIDEIIFREFETQLHIERYKISLTIRVREPSLVLSPHKALRASEPSKRGRLPSSSYRSDIGSQ